MTSLRDQHRGVSAALVLLPVFLLIMGTGSGAYGEQIRCLVDLRGEWRFEIGDEQKWADPQFSDERWVKLHVPGQWEDQGFPGYDGYAWYRKSVVIPESWQGKQLYLDVGFVDDVNEVYVNGFFIGFNGRFPPAYVTAYNIPGRYYLPSYCLRPGATNIIAVRVFDSEQSGGIVGGEPGIYEETRPIQLDQPLGSLWKFSTGDNMNWRLAQFDDSRWENLRVPGYWETQGHEGYDGYGWYRSKFRLAGDLKGERLILFLGRIDDADEVYLNGERIGKTGVMGRSDGEDYKRWRAYTIPGDRLYTDRENLIAVRVYDGFIHGGIYDGPIGIVRREKYLEWEPYHDQSRARKTRFQSFFDWLFN